MGRGLAGNFMTIRKKILLYVALAIFVLVTARVVGIFLPPVAALWLWRIILAPYVLVGVIVVLVLFLTIVLCLGRIRYRVDATIGDDKTAYVEVSYLMRMVHCVFIYRDGNFDNRIRIAWIRPGEEKPNKKKRKKKKADSKKSTPVENGLAAYVAQQVEEAFANGEATKSTNQDAKDNIPAPEQNKSSTEPEEKKDRLKPLKQAKAVLTYPDRKIIIGLCFQCLKKFVKALKPKVLDIKGVIGFDDPCTTGWAMGAYEAAAGVMQLRHKVRLVGNYCEKALELDIEAKGRTRLWGLLWPFIWLYQHKPIRVVLHKKLLRKDEQDE